MPPCQPGAVARQLVITTTLGGVLLLGACGPDPAAAPRPASDPRGSSTQLPLTADEQLDLSATLDEPVGSENDRYRVMLSDPDEQHLRLADKTRDVIAEDYARYLEEVRAMESRSYESSEMVALRARWIKHFVGGLRKMHGADRHRAASTSILLLLNLARFTGDWTTYSAEAHAVATEALEEPPAGGGAAECCRWIVDIAVESGEFRRAAEVLSEYRRLAQDDLVKSAALLGRAEVLYEGGDSEGARRALDLLVASAPDSREARVGKGLLSEIQHLKVGDAPPLALVESLFDVREDSLKPKWIWIEFFSLRCGSCNLDVARMEELNAWLESQGVSVYSIQLDFPNPAGDRRTTASRGVLIPESHAVVSEFNVHFVPRNFVLDSAGRIVHKDVPMADARRLWEGLLGGTPGNAPGR